MDSISFPFEDAPEIGRAIEISQGVLWLRIPLRMALNHVNVYAIDEGDHWTMIDTGSQTQMAKDAWELALSGPLKGKPIGRVIVTHFHPDHIGLAGWFQTEFGASLWTTRTSWLLTRMLVLDELERPPKEQITYWRDYGVVGEALEARKNRPPFNFSDVVAPLPLGYTRIKEGDRLRIGGREWDVYIGEGHAPEHATLWSRDDALVLMGDQVLPRITPNVSVHAREIGGNPLHDWLQSCERFSQIARDEHLALAGHRLPFHGIAPRLAQLIESHERAFARLRDHLITPRTVVQCFEVLYKREISEGEYSLALGEAIAHVNYLHQAGEVQRERGSDGAWYYKML